MSDTGRSADLIVGYGGWPAIVKGRREAMKIRRREVIETVVRGGEEGLSHAPRIAYAEEAAEE